VAHGRDHGLSTLARADAILSRMYPIRRSIAALSAALALTACGGQAATAHARPAAPTAASPAPPPPAPVASPRLSDELELSFETDHGWHRGGEGYESTRDALAHGGQHAMHVRATRPDSSGGGVYRELPVSAGGGFLLRLHGWIRTRDASGHAGLFVDAYDGRGELIRGDNMYTYGPRGTSEWARHEVVFDVPAGTERLTFGALLSGTGDAWFDDLEVELEACPRGAPATVDGVVLGEDGRPAADVLDAAIPEAGPLRAAERSDAGGHFHLEVAPGNHALTATGEGGTAAYWPMRRLVGDRVVELRLGGEGHLVSGQVRSPGALPPGTRVALTRTSTVEGDVFLAEVDGDGRFHARLPVAANYRVGVLFPGLYGDPQQIDLRQDTEVVLDVSPAAAPGDDVVAWLEQTASPVVLGDGDADPAAFDRIVGPARVVAFGQTAAGTHELQELGLRFVRHLVEKRGFTVVALTVDAAAAHRLDDYVQRGEGNLDDAIAALDSWPPDTQEVRTFLEWLRAYNADARHPRKVEVIGTDIGSPREAWVEALAYLTQVDGAYADALPEALAIFGHADASYEWRGISDEARRACLEAAAALVARLDQHRAEYVQRSGLAAWRNARDDAEALVQAGRVFEEGREGEAAADRLASADNVVRALDRHGKTSRAVIWGTGDEAERFASGDVSGLGALLARRLGTGLVSVGLVLGEGGFYGWDSEAKPARRLRAQEVGPAPDDDATAPFLRAGFAAGLVDLRGAPRGPVADWFDGRRPMRRPGWRDDGHFRSSGRIGRRFDAVLFVRHTTAAPPPPRR
jgi:erythromycin esterase